MSEPNNRRPYRVLGTTPLREDGVEKVMGQARFADDVFLPRMLHAAVVRSPHAHAKIRKISTHKATAMPGVFAVLTGSDFPTLEPTILSHSDASTTDDLKDISENCMARDRVLYDGHVVAAVAALSRHVAQQAAEAIDVEYEILAPILDIEEALNEETPALHEDFTPGQFVLQTKKASANASGFEMNIGEDQDAFSTAEVVVEKRYRTRCVHQGYIEPHAVTVQWGSDGIMTVWTCTQGHFAIREQLSIVLQHPLSKIKVIPTEVGGGFGGKDLIYVEPAAALLAKKTGCPVKMVMSRAETLRGTGPSPGAVINVRLASDKKGTLLAADLELLYEAGAYPGGPVGSAGLAATSRYKISNQTIRGVEVLLNKPKMKQYRAPGGVPVNFAVESTIDILASKVGIDPLDFRLKNAMAEGDRMVTGLPCPKIGGRELLEAVRDHSHYRTPLSGPRQGRGMAYALWFGAGKTSSVSMTVHGDGSVLLNVGTPDLSGTRLTLSMQAAEVLGIDVAEVSARVLDTDSIAFSYKTVASRTTHSTGIAVYQAANNALREMARRAAVYWDIEESSVAITRGSFSDLGNPSRCLSFLELAKLLEKLGGPITVYGNASPGSNGCQLAAHLVDVEVEVDTGKINLLRYTAFQDAGNAIHPDYVSGQMQGGAAQGVGWALNEAYFYSEDGKLLNTSLLDYRMPTAVDLPDIETVILETPNPNHPFGVRGVGEVPIMPPAGAIANALYNAAGIRMTELPMSPGTVLEKIKENID